MSSTRFVVKPDEDRRGNLRQMVRGTTVRIETKTGDISRSGIRFYASTEIPCGSQIVLFPPANSGLRPIRARIMRQRIIDTPTGSLVDCGAQYSDDAELQRHSWWIELRKAA